MLTIERERERKHFPIKNGYTVTPSPCLPLKILGPHAHASGMLLKSSSQLWDLNDAGSHVG